MDISVLTLLGSNNDYFYPCHFDFHYSLIPRSLPGFLLLVGDRKLR